MRRQHVLRHSRDQGARQDEGGEHRDDDRLRHRLEQVAGDPAEFEERKPDDRDAQGGDQRRDDDLVGGLDDGLFERFAHFDMAIDVLDHHGRIVDQNADGQRQPA